MKTHRIAVLFSGGKDSMYIIHLWYKLMSELPRYLIFIRPRWESPHELNIHVVSILAKLLGANLTLTTSEKLVETLRKLDIDVLLSADVYVYDHVYWLERVCRKANVELVEPILNEDTYNVLQEIINLGIEFIIISVKPNYEKLLGWVVSRSNINEFIDTVFSSKSYNLTKPNPKIFELAMNKFSLSSSDVFFVGHDKEEIDGAEAIGIRSVEFNNYLALPTSATYKIDHFSELINLTLNE